MYRNQDIRAAAFNSRCGLTLFSRKKTKICNAQSWTTVGMATADATAKEYVLAPWTAEYA